MHKTYTWLLVLLGLACLAWGLYMPIIQNAATPEIDHRPPIQSQTPGSVDIQISISYLDPRQIIFLYLLAIGFLISGIVLIHPSEFRRVIYRRLLFGTAWGAIGAFSLGGGLVYGGFISMMIDWMAGRGYWAVQLGCLGSVVGLLGGILVGKSSPIESSSFGAFYGVAAGAVVVAIHFVSLNPLSLNGWKSSIEFLWASAAYGGVPGGFWGLLGGVLWKWLSREKG